MKDSAIIDEQIEAAAKKALEAEAAKNNSTSWIFKLAITALMILEVWWLKYQIKKKDEELALMKAALEKKKVDEAAAAATALIEAHSAEARRLHEEAIQRVEAAEAALRGLAVLEKEQVERKAQVEKLSNWEDLNKLAGIE